MSKMLTTSMGAKKLGFTPSYIRRMCADGRIKATRSGHDWMFTEGALKNVKRIRKARQTKVA